MTGTVAMRNLSWLVAPLMLAAMIMLNGGLRGPTYFMGDFRAFYCAGAAIAQGANPYLEEPLHSCEVQAGPPAEPSFLRPVALPAPLPPHALLLFVPLSRLPFPVAIALYLALLIAAMSLSVQFFARLTGASSGILNVVFAAITAMVTYYVGQPVPIVFALLGAAALLVREGRWVAASACAAAATLEPHVALPAIVAMFWALPRTRLPLTAFGLGLACSGIAAVGWAVSLSYVRDVIPAHALANAFEWQFSLTSVLTSLGVGAAQAGRLGELMYAGMVVLGASVACRLRRLTADDAALVLIPPAFGVFGGVHVHFQQLAIAFPAVLYVCTRFPAARRLGTSGLALAMIPWNVMGASLLAGAAPLLVGSFVTAMTSSRRRGLAFALLAAAIGLSLLVMATLSLGPVEAQLVTHASPPDALAEASWGEFSRAALARPSIMMQWLRVPTLVGLALGLTAIARAAYAPAARREAAPIPHHVLGLPAVR